MPKDIIIEKVPKGDKPKKPTSSLHYEGSSFYRKNSQRKLPRRIPKRFGI